MQTVLQDLRHAVRALLKHPGYLATALLTLALGIGFSTATFSVIHAVLLRPLAYHEPERLVRVIERNLPRFERFSVSPGHYLFWRDHATAFEAIGVWAAGQASLDAGSGDPERVRAYSVSANLFPLLGVEPILGRNFAAADEQEGSERVAMLSHAAWQRRFAARADIVGQQVRLDRRPVTIIGVMPASFRLPMQPAELWMPMTVTNAVRTTYGSHFMHAIGRLKPGVTLDQAAADMQSVTRALERVNPGSKGWEVLLHGLQDYEVEDVRDSLLVLFGAVSLVLLIACANVANLLLARSAGRHKELAIRSSIGATRGRLIRQLVVEHLALALVSTGAGVLLAAWLLRVLLAIVPDALPPHAVVTLDATVLAFAVGLALLTPLVFGLAPALHAARPNLRELISAGGRQGSGVPSPGTRSALVIAEIALAMTLLVGAGLLIRSFANLANQSPGFNHQGAVLSGVTLLPEKYPEGAAREQFFSQFLDRVAALPAVESVGLSTPMPLVTDYNSGFEIEGSPTSPEERPLTLFYAVSPGFFDAMQIPLRRGRYISDQDRRGGARVVVISEALADVHFAGADPIGKRIRVSQGDDEWREIVGVVGNVKQNGLDEQPRAQVYEPYRQHPYFAGFSLVVRTSSQPAAAIAPDLRGVLRALDPELPLAQVRTLEQVVQATVTPQLFSTTLIAVFGGAALLLAAIGLYGVMAYTVGVRRQEFAIRIAHGAMPRDITHLVLRGAGRMASAGILIGLLGAWSLRGTIESLLFGVSGADPLTYAGVAAVLGVTTMLAGALPAWRATRVDPSVALRGQ